MQSSPAHPDVRHNRACPSARSRLFDFPRPVWLLGWVSLATDAASEAIYPLLPFFLTQVLGAGAVSLGIIEGAAEAANSLLKIVSGRLADRTRAKRPLVLLGYGVSSLARPFIAMTTTWLQVFTVRVLDRVGKGVRSAPRDAMLAALGDARRRAARCTGSIRAWTTSAPSSAPRSRRCSCCAIPGQYRTLFALTIVPGAIAVRPDLLRSRGEPRQTARRPTPGPRSCSRRTRAGQRRAACRVSSTLFMVVLALFTLGNSTDAFLLLRLTDAAGSARFVPLMWAGTARREGRACRWSAAAGRIASGAGR